MGIDYSQNPVQQPALPPAFPKHFEPPPCCVSSAYMLLRPLQIHLFGKRKKQRKTCSCVTLYAPLCMCAVTGMATWLLGGGKGAEPSLANGGCMRRTFLLKFSKTLNSSCFVPLFHDRTDPHSFLVIFLFLLQDFCADSQHRNSYICTSHNIHFKFTRMPTQTPESAQATHATQTPESAQATHAPNGAIKGFSYAFFLRQALPV